MGCLECIQQAAYRPHFLLSSLANRFPPAWESEKLYLYSPGRNQVVWQKPTQHHKAVVLQLKKKERNRFNINTKRLRCNPQCLEKTALKKPNVYYGHSQTVELVFAFLCRVMGCNGHPA